VEIVIVAVVMPFSYEGKHVAQHWATCNWRIHWPMACTNQSMRMPEADILNTCCTLICVDKQGVSIPRGHLLQLNVFTSL